MNMPKSQTLSLDDKQEMILVLKGFLNGDVQLPQLLQAAQDSLVVDFRSAPGQREIKDNLLDGAIEIPVTQQHIRNMLRKYLSEEISVAELSDWAAFIFMAQVFVPAGETEEERWLAGDGPVWDILQRLMTPQCFDGLNREVAQQYIDMLAH